MQQPLDFTQTKFHGQTYDEFLDKERLTGQVSKLYEVLKSGEIYNIDVLSELSGVSAGSIPKRASDLRVYHALDIKATRVSKGLWQYQLIGKMTKEGHAAFIVENRTKKGIVGNKDLYGKMMQAIYAYANQPDRTNEISMEFSATKWAKALAGEIGNIEYEEARKG